MTQGTARPHQVVEVDLVRGVPSLHRRPDTEVAWVLVRSDGVPVGALTLEIPPQGLAADRVAELVRTRLADELAAAPSGFLAEHRAHLERAPAATVVVCTREHPDELRRCLLSLAKQDHPDFVVLVVDNAPVTSATRQVVEEIAAAVDCRYVLEPRPGLSRARNTALAQPLHGSIVAWLDDDEVADPLWLSELTRAFEGRDDVQGLSGLVLPAELDTPAQVWFEQFGGHSKGRGFIPAEFSPRTRREQHPLFPLPPFGVGANMAFRTETLRRYRFDEALGAGTATQGGEDTKVFTELLLDGATIRYWPTALTWHYHRRDRAALAGQLRGYGLGLTAYYTACLVDRPRTALTLAGLLPRGLRTVFGSGGPRSSGLGPDFPRELLADNRRAMLAGPSVYLRTRIGQRRQAHRRAPM